MTDLRDQIFGKPISADEKVFLDYHQNSPWAQEKVKAGVRLFPESVAYMQRELAERARAQAAHEKTLGEIKEQDNAERTAEAPEAAPATGSQPPADGLGGSPGDKPQGG